MDNLSSVRPQRFSPNGLSRFCSSGKVFLLAGSLLAGWFVWNHVNALTPEKLQAEFEATNPDSLEGWEFRPAGINQRWDCWSKDGLDYLDRNGDGRPDMKYRGEPRLSTTEIWWEDTNYDGIFETEIEQGCFHHCTRPLDKRVSVPAVPTLTGTR